MKTWSGSEVHWSRWPRVLLGWVRFLWARLWCRHVFPRLPDRSHLTNDSFGYAHRLYVWRCEKCGATRASYDATSQ